MISQTALNAALAAYDIEADCIREMKNYCIFILFFAVPKGFSDF
jgi:hypothetical protein